MSESEAKPKRDPTGKVGQIYVVQPQYGGGRPDSHRQFWVGRGTKYPSLPFESGGSLLAQSFNKCWAHALGMQQDGYDITHFAMLHDDVVPQNNWLDLLVDALLEAQATDPSVAVMSAVVPIKDWMGLTSTAIDDTNGFSPLRRITMTEVFNLPDVFGAEDCGYPEGTLLVNTGCWVCDLAQPWRLVRECQRDVRNRLDPTWERCAPDCSCPLAVHFEIKDRIRVETTREGKLDFVAEVAPEDWNFSRAVQQLGGKIRATRRVSLSHYGQIPFNNGEPWGTCETDRLLAHRHNGKTIAKEGYEFHRRAVDVEGWLTVEEGETLARFARGKKCLEIGSYCGRSTIWMARVAEIVHAVDTFDGRGTKEPRPTLETFRDNLVRYNVLGQVRIWEGPSDGFLRLFAEGAERQRFDFIFIDGGHDLASVSRDLELAAPLLNPGGYVACHDYGSTKDPDVSTAVNRVVRQGWRIHGQGGSILVLQPPNLQTTYTISEGANHGQRIEASAATVPTGADPVLDRGWCRLADASSAR